MIEIGVPQSQLREQAIRDALTNLFNRRYLEGTLERELARAARESYPLCGISTIPTAAMKRAEDLHTTINALNIPYGRFNLTTTLSMGIAWYPAHGKTKEELMRAADMAMYVAKNTGRNRVIIYDEHVVGGCLNRYQPKYACNSDQLIYKS